MKRWISLALVCVCACINFDALEREALSRLDAGVAAGGSAGGDAGGVAGGQAGGAAGGAVAGGSGGGVGAGIATPRCDGGRCDCACQDGGCRGQCTVELFSPGTVRSQDLAALDPVALASTGHVIAIVDGAAQNQVKVFTGGLALLSTVSGTGDFKTLDARHGEVLAVFEREVVQFVASTNELRQALANGSSCLGGAVYERFGTVERVAVCGRDGGLEAFRYDPIIGLVGPLPIALPMGFAPSLVQVRPDQAGEYGRYLVRGPGNEFVYRFFFGSQITGSSTTVFASQAFVESTEDQQAVIALRTDQGVFAYRGLQMDLALQPMTSMQQVTNGLANLRGVATFTPAAAVSVDVFALEKTGAAGGLSFRNFALEPSNLNDWFVVVDRPGVVRAYNLGPNLSTALVAPFPSGSPDAGVFLVARCASASSRGLCRSGPGTYFERLPID
ncbi:MAG: hypothetical protein SFW67_08325 [Myxococcaceae bacterium]|nr:hypothetical protein [Myxococcaceae bacterium]